MMERETDLNEQTFADWLVTNMRKHGLSQADVARALEVDPAAVSRWVSGRSYPIRQFRQMLAVGFDIPEEQVPGRYSGRRGQMKDE
jgi:transcriptional regulator with XRE-family HTH domain